MIAMQSHISDSAVGSLFVKYSRWLIMLVFIPSALFAAPACEWRHLSMETIPVNADRLMLDRFECLMPDGDSRDIADTYHVTLLTNDGREVVLEKEHQFEAIHLLRYGADFPLNVLYFSSPGGSSVGNSIRVYDKKWQLLDQLYAPINRYQAHNRQGSERELVGFFQIGQSYYVENLRSLGGECMACMRYVVDTYEATDRGLQRVNVRDWDISSYQRFGESAR